MNWLLNDMDQEVFLSDPRVVIRNFNRSDITNDYISWLNDGEVVKFSGQRFLSHDQTSALRYLDSFAGTSNLFLSITDSVSGESIGTLTVYRQINHGLADVGIMIGNRQFWGQGLGLASWNLVISFLINELEIRKVTAGTIRSNKPMLAIMEHSGMKCEAVLPSQQLLNGEPEDVFLYAKYSKIV